MPLKVGAQCEGYGGMFLALRKLLEVEHVWYAEYDPGDPDKGRKPLPIDEQPAVRVLAERFPGAPNHGNIVTFDWAAAEPVDIFTSTFPCQGFSNAGQRRGSEDERHLWPTGVLPALSALMPPLAVFENVPGLLTIENGQVFARILADLDDRGYTVSWTTVGACRVGGCHHRHRVFIVATLFEVQTPMSDPIAHRRGDWWAPAQAVLFGDMESVKWPAAGLTSGGSAWEMVADTCGAGRDLFPTPRTSDTNGAGQHGNGGLDLRTAVAMLPTPLAQDAERNRTSPGDLARKSPALEAVPALLPTPVASDAERASETYSRGNPTLLGSLLPPPTATNRHGNHTNGRGEVLLPGAVALMPTPRATDGVKGGPNQRGSSGDVMLPAAVQPERFGKYAAAVARHERAFGLPVPDPTEPGRNGKPRLAPQFPEWMQSLPAGYLTDVVDRKDALKLAGNGVHWPTAVHALRSLPTFRAAVAALTAVEAVAA